MCIDTWNRALVEEWLFNVVLDRASEPLHRLLFLDKRLIAALFHLVQHHASLGLPPVLRFVQIKVWSNDVLYHLLTVLTTHRSDLPPVIPL